LVVTAEFGQNAALLILKHTAHGLGFVVAAFSELRFGVGLGVLAALLQVRKQFFDVAREGWLQAGGDTQRVPAGGSSYYIKPREAAELKKRLLAIAHGDVTRRASALLLLDVIGQCRLEHGWPANEPRHPDIELLQQLESP
jgi:hypothetical protein